jgi:hypothetical protein
MGLKSGRIILGVLIVILRIVLLPIGAALYMLRPMIIVPAIGMIGGTILAAVFLWQGHLFDAFKASVTAVVCFAITAAAGVIGELFWKGFWDDPFFARGRPSEPVYIRSEPVITMHRHCGP